ncbi:PhoX family protein [Falsiroseomonas sp.]|uniref:PhoX family protein n=1 Tax=Falsiroseomonas sp. TaxID=2870721 RepID=UPI003568DF3C
MSVPRRALLGAAVALAAPPARAQITTLDLAPAALPVRPDDWVAAGHARQVLIRWGDRVTFDAPPWAPRNPTPDAAAAQFGWDGRLASIVVPPMASDGIPRLVACVVHPQVDPAMAWPGGRDRAAVAAAMQGASLLNLERTASGWMVVDGGFQSRRLGADTLCRWSGPAAGTEAVQGILAPEAGCATPWGSALLAEGDPEPWLARLRDLDPRWRTANRFGWVLELDPLDPQSVPVKRSALGRIGAAAVAATRAADGRAVVFLADGRAMGFVYRFLSAGLAEAPDALDDGQLYAARAEGDAIAWLPLPEGAAVDPASAATLAGASRFDRPAALALDPAGPRLLLACRAGSSRSPDQVEALNPRAGAHPGHVLELAGDLAAERLSARVLFLAGDAGEGGSYGRDQPMAALPRYPATLSVDARGRLWVGTDRAGRPGTAADAVFACDLDGPGRAVLLPAYAAPRGAGIGGAATTPEADALLVLVRAPGAEPGASFDRPTTRWPGFEARTPPRTALVAVAKRGGGAVGG